MSTLTSTTSSTNPTLGAGDVGKSYFETDTNKILVWDGSSYRKYNSDEVVIPGVTNNLSAGFDGTDDYIDCGTNTALDPSSWTINQWVKLDDTSSAVRVFATRRTSSSNGYQIYQQSGALKYYGGTVRTLGSGVFSTNTWYMVTVTHTGSSVSGYIDGSLVSSTSDTYTSSGAGGSFYIGRHDDGVRFFIGKIDETAIWNSVLTADEIASLYNNRRTIDLTNDAGDYASSADLVGWWRMGDGSGDTDSGGGTPASGDTIGTVKNIENPGTHDGTASGAVYSNDVVS